ncbi:MAG: RNA methyltransferase, partial [Acidobacteriota bacterium]
MKLPRILSSTSHPLARQARALGRGPRQRREEGLFLVEGPRGVKEALHGGAALVWVLISAERTQQARADPLVIRCLEAGVPVQPIRAALLDKLAPAEQSSGLLAACRLPPRADQPETVLAQQGEGLVVVTWNLQNPGSLGTLIRSATAFGAIGLISAAGADPWNPKAVRASAGALHQLAVARANEPEALPALWQRHRFRPVAAVSRDGRSVSSIDWGGRIVLLVGSEVAGLPDEIASRCEPVTIPTSPSVDSL